MTCIKKIDWLRHLYYESTRWLNSVTGQVKWREISAKDPNNGSKMTVVTLEAMLPDMLQNCRQNNLVPTAYQPEVEYFLKIVGQKIDNGVLMNHVQLRKRVLSLTYSLEMFCRLSETDKIKTVSMLEVAALYTDVTNLLTRLQGMGVQAGSELMEDHEHDNSKFKLIDWLRHMYLMCQKWLNNEAGQMQWKKLNAQDPNNSKDGKRMKLDELKQSLKVLVPGLQDNIVPRPYRPEIAVLRKVLCRNEGKFVNRELSAEENLRKVALKLEDVFGSLGDPQAVLAALDPTQLPWILSVLLRLKEQLEATGEVENFDVEEIIEAVPDVLENEMDEEIPVGAHIQEQEMQEQDVQAVNFEDLEIEEHKVTGGLIDDSNVSDGTEYLNDIINKLSDEVKNPPLDVNSERDASSPSYGSMPPSPPSPHRQSVDEQLSDDSGFYSPEQHNPLGLEDELDHFILDDFGDLDCDDLDFNVLPTVVLRDDEPEFVTSNRKRRLSIDSYEEPSIKRPKP